MVLPPHAALRSHRGELDAVRRDDRAVSYAISARGLADDLPEGSAECPEAAEADLEAHVGDGAVRLTHEKHRALNPPTLQVPMRRLAEHGAEAAAEIGRRDVGHRGYRAHIERLGEPAIHRVPGAQQAPIQIFGFAAHPPTLGEGPDPRGRTRTHARPGMAASH